MGSTMLSQEEILLRALCEDGTDALTKYALADYYESEGDEGRAACMRWAATAGKMPHETGTWDWWLLDSDPQPLSTPEFCKIPGWAMELLKEDGWKPPSGRFAEYLTLRKAWEALLDAWAHKYSLKRVAV